MTQLSPLQTTQRLAQAHPRAFRHLSKDERRMMVDYVLSAGSDDKRTIEKAYGQIKKEKRK